MKKFLTIFFVTLGVIFFAIIIIALYLFIADPLEMKPLFMSADSEVVEDRIEQGGSDDVAVSIKEDKHPSLTSSQEAALETIGIDPASLPSSITPAQEACFREVLGDTRVNAIIAGDTPTVSEFFAARSCL